MTWISNYKIVGESMDDLEKDFEDYLINREIIEKINLKKLDDARKRQHRIPRADQELIIYRNMTVLPGFYKIGDVLEKHGRKVEISIEHNTTAIEAFIEGIFDFKYAVELFIVDYGDNSIRITPIEEFIDISHHKSRRTTRRSYFNSEEYYDTILGRNTPKLKFDILKAKYIQEISKEDIFKDFISRYKRLSRKRPFDLKDWV